MHQDASDMADITDVASPYGYEETDVTNPKVRMSVNDEIAMLLDLRLTSGSEICSEFLGDVQTAVLRLQKSM